MSWALPPTSWEPLLPAFIIDGEWRADQQLAAGQKWTMYNTDPRQVSIEGIDERFLLIDIQDSKDPDEPAQIFLARLPKETSE